MPGDWETYREYKKMLENYRKQREENDPYIADDDVEDLTELFREYID